MLARCLPFDEADLVDVLPSGGILVPCADRSVDSSWGHEIDDVVESLTLIDVDRRAKVSHAKLGTITCRTCHTSARR